MIINVIKLGNITIYECVNVLNNGNHSWKYILEIIVHSPSSNRLFCASVNEQLMVYSSKSKEVTL